MRHYVELPKRLPSARKLARTRSRALPVLLALPLVGVLWVTIGLPILSDATTGAVSNRRARDVSFTSSGSPNGSGKSGDSGSATVALTTFAPDVLQAVGIHWGQSSSSPQAPTGQAPARRRANRPSQPQLAARKTGPRGGSPGPITPALAPPPPPPPPPLRRLRRRYRPCLHPPRLRLRRPPRLLPRLRLLRFRFRHLRRLLLRPRR